MGLKTMLDVTAWNKKIYRNIDDSFVRGDKITATELWESFKIKSSPKFKNACWSEIPIRWTEDVRIMLNKISEEFGNTITIDQIKEKWCNLIVYYSLCSSIDDKDKATKRIRELIEECKKNLICKGVHPPLNA